MSVHHLSGNRYRVRIHIPGSGQRYYTKVVEGKRAANAHDAEMRVKIAAGHNPVAGKVTLRDYAAPQIAARSLRPNTRANYAKMLALIEERLGHRQVRSLRHTDIVEFQTWLGGKAGERFAMQTMTLLRSVLRAAVLDGLIDRNPAAAVATPRPKRSPVVLPTWAEVRALCAEDTGTVPMRTMIATLALTGMRAGEVAGLAVKDVDFLRRTITVHRQVQYLSPANDPDQRGGSFFAAPKTPDSVRTIPVPQELIDMLSFLVLHTLGCPTITLPSHSTSGTPQSHRLLFGGTNSVSVSTRVAAHTGKVLGRRFGPHLLRHLYSTTLLEGAIPLHVVDRVTGHASTGRSVTALVYTHVTDAAMGQVVPAIEEAWRRPLLTGDEARTDDAV